jgi:hypothetical protein
VVTEASNTTLLLDIYQQLGRVEGQNELILQEQSRASDGRRELYAAVESVQENITSVDHKLTTVTTRMDSIEPIVGRMTAFRIQVSVVVVFITAVITGAINIIWLAVTHASQIKDALHGLLR